MSNITGKFVKYEPSVQVEKKDKSGTYNAWRLVYEDERGEIKSIAKPALGLQYLPALKNGLENLVAGDTFIMERQEEGKFQNATKIYKSEGAVQQAKGNPCAQIPVPVTLSTQPNTFEVNNQLKEKQMKFDELRQPIYVRQTALKAASELADVLELKTEQDVLEQAKRFVRFIETGDTGSIEDMPNDDIEVD